MYARSDITILATVENPSLLSGSHRGLFSRSRAVVHVVVLGSESPHATSLPMSTMGKESLFLESED